MAQLVDGRVVEIAAINEGLYFFEKLLSQIEIAGHLPGFDQRRPLPALAPGFVVDHRRIHRLHERPVGAKRAKTQIDAKDETVFGNVTHRLDDFLSNGAEKFSRCGFPLSTARALAFVIPEKKDNVDIGAEVQLGPAELAHAENDKPVVLRLPR